MDTIKLDWAYYNPLSLVLKEKGLLEEEFRKDSIKIEWAQSLGSNKALELLRSRSVDFGSTAGAAALLGRANGNPIKAIYVYSDPEWTALVTRPNSGIQHLQDLKGKRVAVTRGTDPHIFLLRALNSIGLTEKDIELVPLQHPDGKTALEKGNVDAWAGLDPYMAQLEVEKGYLLFFRNKEWNSYGILNVRESFAKDHPELVKRVLAVYEQARRWTLNHRSEAKQILATEAKLTDAVAAKVWERTDFTSSAIGPIQRETIRASGDILKQSQVIDPGTDIDRVLADLIDPAFAPFSNGEDHVTTAADARAAFESRRVDAIGIWDPFYAVLELESAPRVLRDGTGLTPNYTFLFAHQRFAKEHPELIAMILQELKAVDDWANANSTEVASLLSKDLGIEVAALELATRRREYGVRPIDKQIIKDQQHLADVFFQLGEIPKQIRVEDAVVFNAPWWTPELAGR